MSMHVLFVCPELQPFSHQTETSEVPTALAQAHRQAGCEVTIVTPLRSDIDVDRYGLARRLKGAEVSLGGSTEKLVVYEGRFPACDARICFIEHPLFSEPADKPSSSVPNGQEDIRQCHLLSSAVAALAAAFGWKPDIIHGFGWQTGLLPLLLSQCPELADTPTVFSIFDLSAQGLYPESVLEELGIDHEVYHPDGVEFYQQVSLLKAGLVYADGVCLPGPTCKDDACSEDLGFGLHGLFRKLKAAVSGIVGGADHGSFNPAIDQRIEACYTADDLAGKKECKKALQLELGLAQRAEQPLLLLLGSLVDTAGLDVLLDTAERWFSLKLQVAIIGDCSSARASRLAELAAAKPTQVSFSAERAEGALLRRCIAGADALLFPAPRETGCLLQYKALRYGTIPVVRTVGSLRDAVVDFDSPSRIGTGICFDDLERDSFLQALQRLVSIYPHKQWNALVGNAMNQRHSWQAAGERYRNLYERLLQE